MMRKILSPPQPSQREGEPTHKPYRKGLVCWKKTPFLWRSRAGLIFLFFFCYSLVGFSQPFRNEWIKFSPYSPYSLQQYFKIKVTQEGIYRISRSALAGANVPFGSNNPKTIQIFYQGAEQSIYVSGEQDGSFDTNDFIEFYATKNDGKLDATMYKNDNNQPDPSKIPNSNYSLFTDTAVYFLTWDPNGITNGKRITEENNTNFTGTPAAYFIKEAYKEYTSKYFPGSPDGTGSYDPDYTAGEGWFGGEFVLGGSVSDNLTTQNIYSTGPDATLRTVVIGASNSFVSPDHHLKIKVNNTAFIDTTYDGYIMNQFNFTIPLSTLNSATTNVTFSALGNNNSTVDRNTVAFISLKYPHTYDLENDTFYKMIVPNSSSASSYLQISNFNLKSSAPLLYDLTNKKRITVVQSGNDLKALVPNPSSTGEKLCYLTSESQVYNLTSSSIKTVNPDPLNLNKFFNYGYAASSINADYIIITNRVLWSAATDYKNYRHSVAGGSYNVLLADIDSLYDQFAYGISKHPLAIKGFADFLLNTLPTPPKDLFLIGKSIDPSIIRNNANYFALDLVPTYGNPSSDNLLTAGLKGTMLEPAIPTGRLAAQTSAEVSLYLDKVKDYEKTQTAAWMKNILHFAGGDNVYLARQLQSNLDSYKVTVEDTFFGGHVTTFAKTSTAPIQINTADTLKILINNGVGLMTFFGHASRNSFDQSIDSPSEYNNQGKYPFLISNGCYSGDIHTPGKSISEVFVIIANKGTIGFLASSSQGLVDQLHTFTGDLYKKFSREYYGYSIARCIKETIKTVQKPSYIYNKINCLSMTLHGDPAIVLSAFQKPDLTLSSSDIYFTPSTISMTTDSFAANIIITNLGKATNDSFYVKITRIFSDGTSKTYKQRVKGVHYKDTVVVWLKPEPNGAGLNTIQVMLDDSSEIDELLETNNFASTTLLIPSDDIIPIYPYKYAIIPTNTVTLKASTANPFAPLKKYWFEIDTTDAFNSPFKKDTAITQKGGVVSSGTVQLLPMNQDSIVYYWRVGVDSSGYTVHWKESSFIVIPNKTGWSQAHFFQFLKGDTYKYVDALRTPRLFNFISDVQTLRVNSFNYNKIATWEKLTFSINGAVQHYISCAKGSDLVTVAVIDPATGIPWENHIKKYDPQTKTRYGDFGSDYSGACWDLAYLTSMNTFDMVTDTPAQRDSLRKLLNAIPDGFKVVVYSVRNVFNAKYYDDSLMAAFHSIGSSLIDVLKDSASKQDVPFVIMGRKGSKSGKATEKIGANNMATITVDDTVAINWKNGTIYSEIIGPSAKWGSLHWRYRPLESNTQDKIHLDILGIKADGSETMVMPNITPDSSDIYDLSNRIDARTYPYLRMQAYLEDNVTRTVPQLKKWQIYFDEIPEAALNPNRYFSFDGNGNNIQQGDSIHFSMAIDNISNLPMDSMWVDCWVNDNNRIKHSLPYKKLDSLRVGKSIIASIAFKTNDFPGLNSFWIEANPFNKNHQLEQYHFNNIAQISFNTQKDITNPVLDVTFDGVHILNGDIVSAKPDILIQLKDENKYLVLDDTSKFKMFMKTPLTGPNGVAERIYFEKTPEIKTEPTKMAWKKASLPENKFKIEYHPLFSKDGTYELLIQAEDKSNNLSGMYDYKISFEVINKSTITHVLNYPNPFSTATRFAFVLTGSEIPTYFKIQVMTVTGKVVREITLSELGNIHIGRNLTDYAWDGKDEFGNQLANGVYLYRVITRLNSERIDNRATEADSYFKNDLGKMYLMR